MAIVTDRITEALNTTETTEKKIDSITFPTDAKKLKGIYGYSVSTASGTADETVSGYIRITGKNLKHDIFVPLSLLSEGDHVANVGLGFIPLDYPLEPNTTVDFYIALDMITTVNQTGVIFVSYEV